MLLLTSLSFLTMVLFCMAMEKHREQVLAAQLPQLISRVFRPLAWALLTFTFYLSSQLYGWSIGPAVFFGALTAALLPLILLLTYRAKVVPIVAAIFPIIATINFTLS
jgi:hypothetical protein